VTFAGKGDDLRYFMCGSDPDHGTLI
jgi:hypothetical protein